MVDEFMCLGLGNISVARIMILYRWDVDCGPFWSCLGQSVLGWLGTGEGDEGMKTHPLRSLINSVWEL